MKLIQSLLAGVAALCIGASAYAASTEIAGVKVEDSITIAGTKLPLNGAGIRYRGPFKVYVCDLYASKHVSTLEELVAAPGPKRLTMTMLREIESGPFGKLLTRGMEDNNSKADMSKLVPGLLRMSDIFSAHKSLNPGDTIMLDWIPGTGLVVTAKGKVQGEPFKEPEFYKALMSIWLGPVPADFRLKDTLLGTK